jgi:hypothetical protein
MGLPGLLAAKLGAAHVLLTDYEQHVRAGKLLSWRRGL